MWDAQFPFAALVDAIWKAPDRAELARSVDDWLAAHDDEVVWVRRFAARAAGPVEPWELGCLYALSRASELLIGRIAADPACVATARDLFLHLGMTPIATTGRFTPHRHEIVTSEAAESDFTPRIDLVQQVWPGWTLGPLVFQRAGWRVRAGVAVIDPHVAATSTMYWAWSRPNRPVTDLSVGWGHNSSWRTAFRRDVEVDGVRVYNLDGQAEGDAEDHAEIGTEDQVRELVRHRSFVRTRHPRDGSLSPYDTMVADLV